MNDKNIKKLKKPEVKRKQAEEKIYKANRLYALSSHVNQAVVRVRDKQKLMQDICRIAIKYGNFRLAWIGFVDEETKLVKPVAYSGEGSDYLKNIKISITDELTSKGPTGRAILERRSIIFNDLENNPDFAPWHEQALEKGYRSCAAFPLRLYDNVIGALNLYAVEPDFFDKDEIKLLKEAALDISFALEKFKEEDKRRQAEKELEMERNNLLNILESMKDGVYIIDQEYKLQYVNSYLRKGFGLFREQKCFKYIYDRKKICPWCKNKDVIKGKTIHHEVFSKKDGRTYDIIDTPLKNIDGSVFKLSILRDITERKKVEEALKKSEEHYRAVVDHSHDGILIVGKDYKFIYVNDRLCEMLGHTREEIIGHDFREFLDEESRKLVAERYIRRQRGEIVPSRYEFNVVRKNGKKRHVEISSTVVKDSKGEMRTVSQILDITERKRAEEELKKHQDHLEELVKERTAELEKANKELKRYNKLFVGREFRIKELKDKVKELEKELGKKKY